MKTISSFLSEAWLTFLSPKATKSTSIVTARSEIKIKLIFKSFWFRWQAGRIRRAGTTVVPKQDFVGEVAELPSVEETIEMVMAAGIPAAFVRRVYQDWACRYRNGSGETSIRIVPYVANRWVWESVSSRSGIALARLRFTHDTEVVKKSQFEAALCALENAVNKNRSRRGE